MGFSLYEYILIFLQSNLKQFMEHVRKYDMEKLNRMTIRGLDPNFHEPETGGKYG